MDVWAEFRQHFEIDDGSILDVIIEGVRGEHAVATCELLVRLGGSVYQGKGVPTFWDARSERKVTVESLSESASLVVEDTTGGTILYVCLLGVTVNGQILPELGLRVEPTSVSIDWRMGAEWTPVKVAAFLRLLSRIKEISPEGTLSPYLGFVEPDAFMVAWQKYLAFESQTGVIHRDDLR